MSLPRATIDLVGPDTLTGDDIAKIWPSILGSNVRYAGGNLDAFEQQMAQFMPGWQAHDLKVIFRAFQRVGMVPGADARDILEGLCHPLRSYRAFAEETAAAW